MEQLLTRYFTPAALPLMLAHSRQVARKAVAIATSHPDAATLDIRFIEEAALLHDIGVSLTQSPALGCTGSAPYICHGILGREILEQEGLPRHGMVCERHIGVGLTVEDIRLQGLPLPERDMSPVSREEQIIAFADLFFSKKTQLLDVEKPFDQVRNELGRYGAGKLAILDAWIREFS